MAFSYKSEFVFIGRGDESFLENYSYELSDDASGKGGKIFMALEILNNQAEAEDIGEAIFLNFKEKFYETQEGDPYERFEDALKNANAVIETLKEEKVSRFIGNLNVAMGAIVDDVLYISVAGDAEVYLVRKRFVSVVSEGLAEDSKKETFVNIGSGTLELGDSVLFSSTRLLRYITKGEIGKIFGNVQADNIGDLLGELQDFIMTEILGRSAVIGVHAGIGDEVAAGSEEEEGENVFEPGASKIKMLFGLFVDGLRKVNSSGIFGKIADGIKKIIPTNFKFKFPNIKLPGKGSDVLFEEPSSASKLPKIQFGRHMSRERILLIAIFLLVVLVGGIFWIRTRGNQNRLIAEQQARLNHVHEVLNDASTVGQFDKEKASELLNTAEKEALEVLSSKFVRSEAVKTLDDIKALRDSLDDIKRITAPTELVNFSNKRANVSALGLLALKDRLFGFEYNALYEIILDKLQDPLTISDIETVIMGAQSDDPNSLLFLTRTGKMIEYLDSHFGFIGTKDGIWKKGIDMKVYNGRAYILDPERNQIWRYTRKRDTFDVGEAYNQDADLSKGVSIAIDSSVYVLNSDATIVQLYQGQKQNFPLKKLPLSAITDPKKIFTSADLGFIYILEPAQQRVIVFKKDQQNGGAQYQTQYIFENTGTLRDLMVTDNRLYVMDDKKVYFVNLSGL